MPRFLSGPRLLSEPGEPLPVGAPDRVRARPGRGALLALEVVAIGQVLLLVVLGAWDTACGLIVWQETLAASEWVAFSAQSLVVRGDRTTTLTAAQADLAMTAIYGALPQIAAGADAGPYSVTLSAIEFMAASPGATPSATRGATPSATRGRRARVAWSVALGEGRAPLLQTLRRHCGGVREVAAWPQDAGNMAVVATQGIGDPSTVIVADVHYRYLPWLFHLVIGPVDFWESYQLPNLVMPADQKLALRAGGSANAVSCGA